MEGSHLVRAAAVAALTLGVASADAQVVPGSTLHFTGTADAIDIGAAGIVLEFTSGITAGAASTGAFASLVGASGGGSGGTITDFTVGVGPSAIPGLVRIGGFTFDLVSIPAGTSGQDECFLAPAVGQRCTPLQAPNPFPSPFNLTNVDSGDPAAPISAIAAFVVHGVVAGPGSARATPFVGTISASFPGMSYLEALYAVETTGIQGVAYSASFTAVSAVPEPSTYALLATGLLGVAGGARLRRRGAVSPT